MLNNNLGDANMSFMLMTKAFIVSKLFPVKHFLTCCWYVPAILVRMYVSNQIWNWRMYWCKI